MLVFLVQDAFLVLVYEQLPFPASWTHTSPRLRAEADLDRQGTCVHTSSCSFVRIWMY